MLRSGTMHSRAACSRPETVGMRRAAAAAAALGKKWEERVEGGEGAGGSSGP